MVSVALVVGVGMMNPPVAAVPESVLVQISNLKAEQVSRLNDIARFEAAYKQADAGFTADRGRLAKLLGGQ